MREVCSPGYMHHDPQLPGVHISPLDSYIQLMTGFFSIFPDIQVQVHDLFAAGDRVAARWTFSGTQRGEMPGVPPTGKQVEVNCLSIHRINEDKIEECWVVYDAMGMMQQLGVVPSSG